MVNYQIKCYAGRLIWITGSSGVGKTTSAKILAERKGFVFYEGDYYSEDNDYGDMIRMVKYEPSVQRKLAGKSPEERKLAVKEMWEEGELKPAREYHYRALCEDINRERARIGGNILSKSFW